MALEDNATLKIFIRHRLHFVADLDNPDSSLIVSGNVGGLNPERKYDWDIPVKGDENYRLCNKTPVEVFEEMTERGSSPSNAIYVAEISKREYGGVA